MAELNVRLRAEISDLEKKLAIARKQLIKTGETAESSTKKITRSTSGAAIGMGKFTKQTANATPAMLEFSRVVQDAPFGIQGVANNIQQLTANFGNLSKSAGGSRNALRLMLATLKGPAGILLAVSAVTALMVAFGDKLKFAKDKVEDLSKELEELNENFELELSTSKLLEKNAKLQGLEYKGILNSRLKILDAQLQEVQGLILARKQLLLLNKASQETVSNFEAVSQSAVVTAGALVVAATRGLGDAFQEQVDFLGDIVGGFADVLGISIDTTNAVTATKKEKEEEERIVADLKKLENERLSVENQRLQLLKQINETQTKYLTLSKAVPNKLRLDEAFGLTPEAITSLEKKARLAAFKIGNALRPESFVKPNTLKQRLTEYEIILQNFTDDLDNWIVGGFTNVVSGIGQAIGQSLAEGGNILKGVTQALLGSFGQILSQLGQMMIEMGLSLILAKAALKSLNPALAIAGGAALVAIGSAFSSGAQAASGAFGSGSVAGQGSASSSFSSGSTSSISSTGIGRVVFEIKGTKLIGVLNNTLDNNSRLGGNLTIG